MSRGLFGWDLPPGVSINDIPGNRPEDEEYERWWDDYAGKAENVCPLYNSLFEIFDDELIILIDLARDLGYAAGHTDGFNDAKLDQQLREADEAEKAWRAQQKDFEAAHAEGLHADAPREGCPECEYRANRC